jgi:hypothetical protein
MAGASRGGGRHDGRMKRLRIPATRRIGLWPATGGDVVIEPTSLAFRPTGVSELLVPQGRTTAWQDRADWMPRGRSLLLSRADGRREVIAGDGAVALAAALGARWPAPESGWVVRVAPPFDVPGGCAFLAAGVGGIAHSSLMGQLRVERIGWDSIRAVSFGKANLAIAADGASLFIRPGDGTRVMVDAFERGMRPRATPTAVGRAGDWRCPAVLVHEQALVEAGTLVVRRGGLSWRARGELGERGLGALTESSVHADGHGGRLCARNRRWRVLLPRDGLGGALLRAWDRTPRGVSERAGAST